MARRIIVNRSVEREVFLHNILEGLLSEINKRFDILTEPERKSGWKSEAVNGVIILAMLNEGWINAIGQQTFAGWNPKEGARERLKKIRRKFLQDLHFSKPPLIPVEHVLQIRNDFAHSIPLIETRTEENVIVDESDQETFFRDLRHPAEDRITIESYRTFRSDSEKFRLLLLERSGLNYFDMRTKAQESSIFLREVD